MSLVWNWPQLVWLGFVVFGIGVSIATHGKPREPMNAGIMMFSVAVSSTLLYFGGFWAGATP